MQLEICANCEELIGHTPVYADGLSYCCAGCGAGGPCACTYADDHLATDDEATPPATASLLRFRRPNDVQVIVQVSGFADQRDIIRLAQALEVSPALADMTLACLADGDAWMTVHAASADIVASVMSTASPDVRLDIIVNQNLVEARAILPTPMMRQPETSVTPPRVAPARSFDALPGDDLSLDARFSDTVEPLGSGYTALQGDLHQAEHAFTDEAAPYVTLDHVDRQPRGDREEDSVLPPRPRFRVFRPAPPTDDGQTAELSTSSGNPEFDKSRPEDVEYVIVATRPFRSFAAVNSYHQSIRGLDGVKSTHVQRFDRGTLYLAVTYQSRVPLRTRLESLDEYVLDVVNATSSKIDVALRGTPPLARTVSNQAGGGDA